MSIALVGLSFRTAPVALREQVTAAYAALGVQPHPPTPSPSVMERGRSDVERTFLSADLSVERTFLSADRGATTRGDGGAMHRAPTMNSRSLDDTSLWDVAERREDGTAVVGEAPAYTGEVLVLSTCNRFEVYVADNAATPEGAVARARAVITALAPRRGADMSVHQAGAAVELAPHVYSYAGAADVAEHLFTVAAGLDSLVVGEAQILGQVGDALQAALAHGTAGRQLTALMRYAIAAGRRVRNETSIGQGSGSVSHAAVALAKQTLGDLRGRRVLLVGAGKMAEIAAHTLAGDEVGAVRVLNRDPARAAAVAAAIGGDWCGWDELPAALAWADVVITSTGAPHTLIHAQTVAASLPLRGERPLLIIDLAVPRDVDRAVGDLAGVQLADMDTLQAAIADGLHSRQDARPAAQAIIADEVAQYQARMAALGVAPTIADLRDRAERIREAEVQKALRKLGTLDPAAQRAVEALSVALVNKLLHAPTVELKRHATDTRFTQAARTLFGLQPDVE